MNLARNFALGVATATLARYTFSSAYDVTYPSSYTVCTTGNGTIYTVDETNPTAECISVKDGRLVAIGSRGKFLFQLPDIQSVTMIPFHRLRPRSLGYCTRVRDETRINHSPRLVRYGGNHLTLY